MFPSTISLYIFFIPFLKAPKFYFFSQTIIIDEDYVIFSNLHEYFCIKYIKKDKLISDEEFDSILEKLFESI